MSGTKRQLDQIAAIKARVGGLPSAPPKDGQPAAASATAAQQESEIDRAAQARSHFTGRVEHLVANRAIEHIPTGHIAPDLRPEMRQPRMVPLPEELVVRGAVPPAYQELVAELRDLGASLTRRQLQPIVVYPGSSQQYPAARYLILIGQRRWTAAHLVGMPSIDAVVIDPPSPLDRVSLQYAENEDREDFSDMERAWALQQFRQAMGDEQTPITDAMTHLGIKRSRAYQLLRLLAFTPAQQQTIALLRLQERQILSLTDAFHQGKLSQPQVSEILQRLSEIAAERALANTTAADQETTQVGEAPRRSGIDAATVARLVARMIDQQTPPSNTVIPRWYAPLRQNVSGATRNLRRAFDRVDKLGPQEARELRDDLHNLQTQVGRLLERVEQAQSGDAEQEVASG